MEEMGIELDEKDIQFGHVTNDPMESEGKHYVTIFMLATPADATVVPQNCEPEKCEGWQAYSWEDLKSFEGELFGPLKRLLAEEPAAVYNYIHSNLRQGRRQAGRPQESLSQDS